MPSKQNHAPFVDVLEHDDYTAPETKRVLNYGWDAVNLQKVRQAVNDEGKTEIIASSLPIPTGASTEAKQDTANTLLGGIAGMTPTAYDYVSLSYTGDNLTGVVFKTGGSGGTTVATLTLAYTGSTLTSVTKS